jgi:hypothetical protein
MFQIHLDYLCCLGLPGAPALVAQGLDPEIVGLQAGFMYRKSSFFHKLALWCQYQIPNISSIPVPFGAARIIIPL